MKTTKHFALAALCVATALCWAGTASADELTPPANSPSPDASGSATTKMSGPAADPDRGMYWIATTTFHVQGLQPNTVYGVIVYDGAGGGGGALLTTNNNGGGRVSFSWVASFNSVAFYGVYLINPDGSQTLVLSGW